MLCPSKLHHGLPAFKVAGHAARAIALAQRVEFAQPWRLLAGGDLLGQQPTGRRALLHAPHAVPTRDEDPLLGQLAYQRTSVWTQWARAHPYLVALGPANPVEKLARRIDHGVDDGGGRRRLGTT